MTAKEEILERCSEYTQEVFDDLRKDVNVMKGNIKIAKKCIDNKTFIQNNVTNISQLKENGIFMNYAGFKRINPQVNVHFLSFIGIIRAVKQYRQKLTLKSTRINRNMQPHHFISIKHLQSPNN